MDPYDEPTVLVNNNLSLDEIETTYREILRDFNIIQNKYEKMLAQYNETINQYRPQIDKKDGKYIENCTMTLMSLNSQRTIGNGALYHKINSLITEIVFYSSQFENTNVLRAEELEYNHKMPYRNRDNDPKQSLKINMAS